jgi:cation:H+ antiporter
MMNILMYSLLAVISTAVIWKGSGLLEKSAEQLSLYYGLPVAVHGAVVVAVGSSFPEISSVAISALLHGEFDLGVGTIVGSAIFNILVIPAVAALSTERLSASRDVVHRDAQFYIISILVLFMTFALGATYLPVTEPGTATLTRPLVLVPIGAYILYIFLHYQDTKEHTPIETPQTVNLPQTWGRLFLSLGLIVLSVEGLVTAALGIGDAFAIPPLLLGAVIVAAGTSLPDAFVSIRAAQSNKGVTSLTNVLGSNTFDLLIAVPFGVLLVGTTTVNYAASIPLLGFLTLVTLVFIVFTRTQLELSRTEAYGFLVLYALFVVWMALEAIGVLSVVQT